MGVILPHHAPLRTCLCVLGIINAMYCALPSYVVVRVLRQVGCFWSALQILQVMLNLFRSPRNPSLSLTSWSRTCFAHERADAHARVLPNVIRFVLPALMHKDCPPPELRHAQIQIGKCSASGCVFFCAFCIFSEPSSTIAHAMCIRACARLILCVRV